MNIYDNCLPLLVFFPYLFTQIYKQNQFCSIDSHLAVFLRHSQERKCWPRVPSLYNSFHALTLFIDPSKLGLSVGRGRINNNYFVPLQMKRTGTHYLSSISPIRSIFVNSREPTSRTFCNPTAGQSESGPFFYSLFSFKQIKLVRSQRTEMKSVPGFYIKYIDLSVSVLWTVFHSAIMGPVSGRKEKSRSVRKHTHNSVSGTYID